MQFLIALLEHPILFVIMSMYLLGFVGMTYDFVLRMYEKKPFLENSDKEEHDVDSEQTEKSCVPNQPTKPKDVLEGAEEIEGEDGDNAIEYIYLSDDPMDDII